MSFVFEEYLQTSSGYSRENRDRNLYLLNIILSDQDEKDIQSNIFFKTLVKLFQVQFFIRLSRNHNSDFFFGSSRKTLDNVSEPFPMKCISETHTHTHSGYIGTSNSNLDKK